MLKVNNVSKTYNDHQVLDNVSFEVTRGEIVALLAQSGSGKSTLLKIIAGIEQPTAGDVTLAGKVGIVFQDFNLFPHMSVLDNLTYTPIKVLNQPRQQVEAKAREKLAAFGMLEKAKNFPNELSGGQKQRVAIIRTLMLDPEIILFDEPTSALDPGMTAEVGATIKRIANDNIAIVVATHDLEFIKNLATRTINLAA